MAVDGEPDPWQDHPRVTREEFGDYKFPDAADDKFSDAAVETKSSSSSTYVGSVALTIVSPITYLLSPLLMPLSERVSCKCCATPRKKNTAIWDTADLGWWDFQRRRIKSMWLAKAIYDRVKDALKVYDELDAAGQSEEAEHLWHSMCVTSAREIRLHAEECKGIFVKATQQLSTMSGIIADECLDEFRKTTEALPISTPDEVFRVLQRGLGRSPRDTFVAFDRAPIASASIGQVHKAHLLLKNGEIQLVAVKVQHDGVGDVFTEDLTTLAAITEQVAYWAPHLDFRKALEEFNEVIPKELNFALECEALERAQRILQRFKCPVIVPEVYPNLCSKEVLVMDYVEAGPIINLGDDRFCKLHNLDKTPIMRNLLEAFALLVFREGLIHGDPHSGNIRLQIDKDAPGGAYAVIFDWGMTKSLSSEDRLSLALFFHSLANMDIPGLFDALHFLGFRFDREMLTDEIVESVVGRLRSTMKDTISKEQTQANTKKAYKEFKQRTKDIETSGTDPTKVVKDFPSSILFFLRMCECMRGLCVACQAQDLPILEIFSHHARQAYREGSKRPSITATVSLFVGGCATSDMKRNPSLDALMERQLSPGSPGLSPAKRQSSANRKSPQSKGLDAIVRNRLEAFMKDKKVVGAQVAVIQDGNLVCDIPVGTLSTIDMRAITSRSLFPLMGTTAGIATLALLRHLRRGAVSKQHEVLDLPISMMWPEFAGGNCQIQLRDVLAHAVGLQDAYPTDFSPLYLNDIEKLQRHLEVVSLSAKGEARYAYLLQAFVLAKLGQDLAPQTDLASWIAKELGYTGFQIGLPSSTCATICRDLPSLSRVSMAEVEEARAKRTAKKEDLNGSEDKVSGECLNIFDACVKNPLPFDPLQANVKQSAEGEVPFRAGLCLGASARGLAMMLSSKDLHEDLDAICALEPQSYDGSVVGWLLTAGACQFTAGGLQSLELQRLGCKALFSRPERGFGIVCGMGPCVMHFPTVCQGGLTIAVTVNNVIHGRDVAASVVTDVLNYFGFHPRWTRMPVRVMADVARLATHHPMLLPIFQQLRASSKATEDEEKPACCTSGVRKLGCLSGT